MDQYKEKYFEMFKIIYPKYSDEQINELIELKIEFWRGLIENFDDYFDI
jgi:hypothetical protein